jgi:hypothetical protein
VGTRLNGQARFQADRSRSVLAAERVYLIEDRQAGVGPDFVGPANTY